MHVISYEEGYALRGTSPNSIRLPFRVASENGWIDRALAWVTSAKSDSRGLQRIMQRLEDTTTAQWTDLLKIHVDRNNLNELISATICSLNHQLVTLLDAFDMPSHVKPRRLERLFQRAFEKAELLQIIWHSILAIPQFEEIFVAERREFLHADLARSTWEFFDHEKNNIPAEYHHLSQKLSFLFADLKNFI